MTRTMMPWRERIGEIPEGWWGQCVAEARDASFRVARSRERYVVTMPIDEDVALEDLTVVVSGRLLSIRATASAVGPGIPILLPDDTDVRGARAVLAPGQLGIVLPRISRRLRRAPARG